MKAGSIGSAFKKNDSAEKILLKKFKVKQKNKNCSRAKGILKYKDFDKSKGIKKSFLISRNPFTKKYTVKRRN